MREPYTKGDLDAYILVPGSCIATPDPVKTDIAMFNRNRDRPDHLESTKRPGREPGNRGEVVSMETWGLEFLLFGMQSPVNLGMILRVAETYLVKVSILDLAGLLDDPEKVVAVSDFSCGAWSRRGLHRMTDASEIPQARRGRRFIATSITPGGVALPQFRFQHGDLVVLGNEYDGLPDLLVESADGCLYIPMAVPWAPKEQSRHPIDPNRKGPVAREGQPSLNVAITAAILCYAAYTQWLDVR